MITIMIFIIILLQGEPHARAMITQYDIRRDNLCEGEILTHTFGRYIGTIGTTTIVDNNNNNYDNNTHISNVIICILMVSLRAREINKPKQYYVVRDLRFREWMRDKFSRTYWHHNNNDTAYESFRFKLLISDPERSERRIGFL